MDSAAASTIIGAAQFLVGSILICIAASVIAATVLLLNRVFSKWWVPIKLTNYSEMVHDKKVKEPKL
jgi:hypothetical protein